MLLRLRLALPRTDARELTVVEERIDAWARARLARLHGQRWRAGLVEAVVFVLKQGWACLFGGLLLAVLLAARFWYPEGVPLVRDDALTLAAVAIQVGMLASRLETPREMRVVLLFHVVGTVMELFKTDVGSWSYAADGVLRLGGVPLFSGFMYGAVGSYLVRVVRIFDLRFDRYPRRLLTALVAAGIYVNFFTHHWVADARWLLLGAVVVVYGRTVMHVRVHAVRLRMPVLLAFALVATFIWVAENVATFAGAWLYPSQADGWHVVAGAKLVSWFLLMIVSVVLVTWVHPPRPPDGRPAGPDAGSEARTLRRARPRVGVRLRAAARARAGTASRGSAR